jgi:phosphoribosylformylglycinamidine cyclo-ligase
MSGVSYKDSGVDLDVYNDAMKRLPKLMHRTFSPRVKQLDGGFAGLFQLDFDCNLFRRNYQNPVLVSGADGVGTKLKVAQKLGRHETIGIDLVAMCVNDTICCGAEPLFFLDYIAMSHDDPVLLEQLVKGISDGCVASDSALLGGETAIMPDHYQPGDYELAGFCVGVVEKSNLIDGKAIAPDDVVIGIASNGVHANGFSLVRKIVFDHAMLDVDSPFEPEPSKSIGDVLMEPTLIYTAAVRKVLNHYRVKQVVHGIAHITGGGLAENMERILPAGISVEIDRSAWRAPPVFEWLQKLGDVERDEMLRVFNMGIGMTLIVSPYYADSVIRMLNESGHDAMVIGSVKAHEDSSAKSVTVSQ